MKYWASIILAFTFTVIEASPALAHSPYFTQVEKIRLPDGDVGEARLLNGDGLFGPDPVRVLILDAQGRLLARSPQSYSMALSCRDGGECLIIDLTHDKVLELEASSFRQGDPVPELSDDERGSLWELESGVESWGFSLRSPVLSERPASLLALLLRHLPMMILDVLVIVVICLLTWAIWLIIRTKRMRMIQHLLAAAAVVAIASASLFLAFLSWLLSMMWGLPFTGWLISFAIGGMLAFAGYRADRRMRSVCATDQFANP